MLGNKIVYFIASFLEMGVVSKYCPEAYVTLKKLIDWLFGIMHRLYERRKCVPTGEELLTIIQCLRVIHQCCLEVTCKLTRVFGGKITIIMNLDRKVQELLKDHFIGISPGKFREFWENLEKLHREISDGGDTKLA